MKYKKDLEALVDELEAARIMSGALFEKCGNDRENDKALVFQMLRDNLNVQIVSLKSFYSINGGSNGEG